MYYIFYYSRLSRYLIFECKNSACEFENTYFHPFNGLDIYLQWQDTKPARDYDILRITNFRKSTSTRSEQRHIISRQRVITSAGNFRL